MSIAHCIKRLSLLLALLASTCLNGCSGEKAMEARPDAEDQAEQIVHDRPATEDVAVQPPGELEIDSGSETALSEPPVSVSVAPPPSATMAAPTDTHPRSMARETMRSAAPEPMFAEPMFAEPMFAEPMFAEPMFAEPMFAEPMFAESASDSEPEIALSTETDAPPRMSADRPDSATASEPDSATASEPDSATASESVSTGPFTTLPAGASHDAENGYATVAVYYATDRAKDSVPLSAYAITGNRDAFILLAGSALAFLGFAAFNFWRKRSQVGLAFSVFGGVASAAATLLLFSGTTQIEKHGVTYNSDRGTLVRGIAEVTVPDIHERGVVERPSLLRFEVREDQSEHIVLTSATELSDNEFERRLSETVNLSPGQDVLVFIHGYNVDFESAIQRTAQIAIDLPFEGVPICYSWPSQAELFGYTVDETNAAWTQTHLKQFLLGLARDSGARSINVVAHSMGNRPTTGAMVEMGWEQSQSANTSANTTATRKLFDRVVLAAPDVDADRFRRDLAPHLSKVAEHVTLYASSDDQALVASKQVHGYPRAGESGDSIVVVPGIETVDVSGVDLSLLGHSYYGDAPSMLQDLYQLVRNRLPAARRRQLSPRPHGELTYWQLIAQPSIRERLSSEPSSVR